MKTISMWAELRAEVQTEVILVRLLHDSEAVLLMVLMALGVQADQFDARRAGDDVDEVGNWKA